MEQNGEHRLEDAVAWLGNFDAGDLAACQVFMAGFKRMHALRVTAAQRNPIQLAVLLLSQIVLLLPLGALAASTERAGRVHDESYRGRTDQSGPAVKCLQKLGCIPGIPRGARQITHHSLHGDIWIGRHDPETRR